MSLLYGAISRDQVLYKDSFFRRWFSFKTLEENHNLVEFYDHELGRMNSGNVYKYLQGYQRRQQIPAEDLKKIHCQVLMFVGNSTPHENEAINVMKQLKPGQSEWIRVLDAGMLITEDRPHVACPPIDLMLQ